MQYNELSSLFRSNIAPHSVGVGSRYVEPKSMGVKGRPKVSFCWQPCDWRGQCTTQVCVGHHGKDATAL